MSTTYVPQSLFSAIIPSSYRLGVGHCIPKARLFTDLLSAVGIEARVRLVNIDGGVLRGLLPVPSTITHAYTEVKLPSSSSSSSLSGGAIINEEEEDDGEWVAVDSYNVDTALEKGARHRLSQEGGEKDGYGICHIGTRHWDGKR